MLNIQKIANNNGIDWDTVKTGQLADLSTITRPKNPQELEIYQAAVNRFYDLFIETVAKGRKLSPDKVRTVAQGRVWTGKDAVKIGLVDQIGGLEAAVQYAAKTAKLGDDWSLQEYPRSQSWQEELFTLICSKLIKLDFIINKLLILNNSKFLSASLLSKLLKLMFVAIRSIHAFCKIKY